VLDLRRARFANGWFRTRDGEWKPILKARFTASNAEWESKDNIDAGMVDGSFYLATGGDIHASRELRSIMGLAASLGNKPSLPEVDVKQ
jgi:hypothetical protein